MTDLTPQQLKKLERLASIVDKGNIGVFEHLVELEDKVDAVIPEVKKITQETVAELKSNLPNLEKILEKVKGDPGNDGKDSTVPGPQGEPGKSVQGPPGKDGKDSKVPGPPGEPGKTPDVYPIVLEASKRVEERLTPLIPKIEDIESDLPKLGPEIRNALELLKGEERLDKSAIRGLTEWFKKFEDRLVYQEQRVVGRGGGSVTGEGARMLVKDIDLSASLDGLTTTFNLQAIYSIISVDLSSYPYGSLRKNIDYTYTDTSITFTSNIDPVTQLSAGQQCILTVVQA